MNKPPAIGVVVIHLSQSSDHVSGLWWIVTRLAD